MESRVAQRSEPASDGRLRRGERSRDAIVQALFELVGEGIVSPTGQQVAERAGVGIRSVFRHFSDMESLFAEMGARLQRQALPLLRVESRAGGVAQRAGALVEQRVRFFERIAPFKRSANLQRHRSAFLQRQHAALQRELRADLLRRLPELERARDELVDALDLALSFEAWDRLRCDQRLGPERAKGAFLCAVRALVRELRRGTASRE